MQNETQTEPRPSVLMFQSPQDWSIFDKRFIAVYDPSAETKTSPKIKLDYVMYWSDVLASVGAGDPSFPQAGKHIVDAAGLVAPREKLKRALSLTSIDDQTAAAVNAALFMAFNSTPIGTDLDAVVLGIATFLHSHKSFESMTSDEPFQPPFGKDTAWVQATIGEPEAG